MAVNTFGSARMRLGGKSSSAAGAAVDRLRWIVAEHMTTVQTN